MTNYLKTLVPIFFITINLLANDFLDSTYSRLEINQGLIADHDFRASTSNYGINYILEDIQMVLAYEITSNKYDEIFGSDFSSLDVEADWTSLGLGFLFKRENVHVIPSLSIGSGNVSLSSMDASNIDYAEVGVKFRVSANDKTIINFNINYVTFGNGKILHDKRNQIISRLESFEHQVSSDQIFNFLENIS